MTSRWVWSTGCGPSCAQASPVGSRPMSLSATVRNRSWCGAPDSVVSVASVRVRRVVGRGRVASVASVSVVRRMRARVLAGPVSCDAVSSRSALAGSAKPRSSASRPQRPPAASASPERSRYSLSTFRRSSALIRCSASVMRRLLVLVAQPVTLGEPGLELVLTDPVSLGQGAAVRLLGPRPLVRPDVLLQLRLPLRLSSLPGRPTPSLDARPDEGQADPEDQQDHGPRHQQGQRGHADLEAGGVQVDRGCHRLASQDEPHRGSSSHQHEQDSKQNHENLPVHGAGCASAPSTLVRGLGFRLFRSRAVRRVWGERQHRPQQARGCCLVQGFVAVPALG